MKLEVKEGRHFVSSIPLWLVRFWSLVDEFLWCVTRTMMKRYGNKGNHECSFTWVKVLLVSPFFLWKRINKTQEDEGGTHKKVPLTLVSTFGGSSDGFGCLPVINLVCVSPLSIFFVSARCQSCLCQPVVTTDYGSRLEAVGRVRDGWLISTW